MHIKKKIKACIKINKLLEREGWRFFFCRLCSSEKSWNKKIQLSKKVLYLNQRIFMIDSKLNIDKLKDIIQDCNINFLIGSGLSAPYLSLLGVIERLLTELSHKKEEEKIEKTKERIIRASLYKKFFDDVIFKNVNILKGADDVDLNKILNNYKNFITLVNTILLNRRSSILSRQVNIFTTNFDIFLEKSMEISNVEYNDGFSGHFNPIFNLSNFKKSFFKRSLHYENIYELPVFNLMKIHGSLTWKKEVDKENIYFDQPLKAVENIQKIDIPKEQLIDIKTEEENHNNVTIDCLISRAKDKKLTENIEKFIEEYEKLSIINPTKEKFKETILNRNHYELLRIYSTELEKENTVLFVMGFSFSDEHIRELTVRVANSNPTLKIYIFAHTEESKGKIKNHIDKSKPNNNNIKIISPTELESGSEDKYKKENQLNLEAINKRVFESILRGIGAEGYKR